SSPQQNLGEGETHLYNEYQPLWKHILEPLYIPSTDFPEEKMKEISSIIYDEFLLAIIKLIQKLNLNYTIESDGLQVQPEQMKDFDMFLNLVEFCKAILPQTHPEFFTRWV